MQKLESLSKSIEDEDNVGSASVRARKEEAQKGRSVKRPRASSPVVPASSSARSTVVPRRPSPTIVAPVVNPSLQLSAAAAQDIVVIPVDNTKFSIKFVPSVSSFVFIQCFFLILVALNRDCNVAAGLTDAARSCQRRVYAFASLGFMK